MELLIGVKEARSMAIGLILSEFVRKVVNFFLRLFGMPYFDETKAAKKLVLIEKVRSLPEDEQVSFWKNYDAKERGEISAWGSDEELDEYADFYIGGYDDEESRGEGIMFTESTCSSRHAGGLLVTRERLVTIDHYESKEVVGLDDLPEEIARLEIEMYWVKDGQVYGINDTVLQNLPHLPPAPDECESVDVSKKENQMKKTTERELRGLMKKYIGKFGEFSIG